ncbi:MAG: Maf family protein [Alphaproteobacteria bacterium]|nr:Maf family protein [Alphaproteobacteria bacterium]
MAKIQLNISLMMASTSIFRRRMLEEAKLPCIFEKPLDEEDDIKSEVKGQPFPDQALALASYKGKTLSKKHPETYIISSDQMAVCEGTVYSKPKSQEEGIKQLMALSGKVVELYTAAIVQRNGVQVWSYAETPKVQMRSFTETEAIAYLQMEPEALYCCGSCKLEGVGSYLVHSIDGDPYTIQGLPVNALINWLLEQKYVELIVS